ncbi:MAG: hypothetical protein ABI867_06375 [Kofleriaceae bacterium]
MKAPSFAGVLAVTLAALAGEAAAGPLADALARHGDRDVDSLRAQRADVGARCTLGAVYAKRNDLSRAALYLTDCGDAELPDEVAADVARIGREVQRKLRDSDLAVIEVTTNPAKLVLSAETDALPGETFTTPATLYVKPGSYTVNARQGGNVFTSAVTAEKRSRTVAIVETEPRRFTKVGPPATKTADFRNDIAEDTQTTGAPPDIKHKNMIRDKYLKGLEVQPTVATADNPNAIEDPLATHEAVRGAPRTYWLGVRLGGGMFDDGASAARAGISVAGAARFTLAGNTFLAGRLDYSRRGGDAGIDVLGAGAGIGQTVIDTHAIGIALLAQLRGDLRLADAANRAGLSVAAGVELALPRSPFSAGMRFEQGLTTIVPGARDRAVLFELGVDWR